VCDPVHQADERRSSSVRSAREAELADVVGIFQVVDVDLGNLLDGWLPVRCIRFEADAYVWS